MSGAEWPSVSHDGEARMKAEREAQLLQLAAKAPLRRPVVQHDVDGLALFDAVRSPVLL